MLQISCRAKAFTRVTVAVPFDFDVLANPVAAWRVALVAAADPGDLPETRCAPVRPCPADPVADRETRCGGITFVVHRHILHIQV
jgi:hypothetical protein